MKVSRMILRTTQSLTSKNPWIRIPPRRREQRLKMHQSNPYFHSSILEASLSEMMALNQRELGLDSVSKLFEVLRFFRTG